ncbi:MAG: 50S ribosomal protein L19 [Deltaproteobacteria bacterium]|nr:50S ribosomal protein L19 [Deltaproteobacteria bacterium]
MNIVETIESEIVKARARNDVDVRPGDTVRVHVRIVEGNKERTQVYEGTVIRIKLGGPRTTFTVRKISSGVGVERIFPASSPNIMKIEITARHKVRRAKLHYLRDRQGKAARLKPMREFVANANETKVRHRKRGKRKHVAAE